jgi:hypothetical protein
MIVCFFFFGEVRSGQMSSYDPGGWGHLPKELFASFAPSNMVCICRLYFLYLRALPFHLVFIGKINHVETLNGMDAIFLLHVCVS